MLLTHRLAQEEDFEDWYNCLFYRFRHAHVLREITRTEWRTIFRKQPNAAMVVEDIMRPQGEQMVAFALTLFVTNRYVEWIKRGERPWVNSSVASPLPDGSDALLTMQEIAYANSTTGLNALIARYQQADPERLIPEEAPQIRQFMYYAYMNYYRGHLFKELLMESVGIEARDNALEGGFKERSDFSAYFGSQLLPPQSRPFLMGLTREEAVKETSLASYIYAYSPPRFHFNAEQKDLLIATLAGITKEDYASSRCISIDGMKARWNALYDKVERVDVNFFPQTNALQPHEKETRGKEKQARLLLYLRDHPEELRPTMSDYSRKEQRDISTSQRRNLERYGG